MTHDAGRIQRVYLILMLGNTLAASFIWGINTLFLLDAGLSNLEAFAANAFYTVGMVLFEVPTGVVADTVGRKASYLLGTVTLAACTVLYWWLWVVHARFAWWALVSIGLGLGFTFFSGAIDAWLVDALTAVGFDGSLESVFGRGLMVSGGAMLAGSVAGGALAQATNLGVPFLVRAGVLLTMFVVASVLMRDLGFVPDHSTGPIRAARRIMAASVEYGLRRASVRYVMLSAPFLSGVGVYAFYALQPYLLQLYGDEKAYGVAGLAAAVLAGSQIVGGWAAPRVRALFRHRTSVLVATGIAGAAGLVALGAVHQFAAALVLLPIWGLLSSAAGPVRQAYLNDMIPSQQRATVLSFDSMLGSAGGAAVQPALGRAADVWGYGASLMIGGAIQLVAIPLLWASRRQDDPADVRADV